VQELLTRNGTGRRPSILDQFKPYLHQRWNDGCTNAATLFAEITARGYRGGPTAVRHYLRQFRTTTCITRPARKPPSVRRVAGWIMTDPATIDPANQLQLDAILDASPHLTALAGHVRAFATIMCSLRGHDLDTWLTASTPTTPTSRHCGRSRWAFAATRTRSPPDSPCPGTAASSKATSTASKCSNARCSAAPNPTYSASVSY
jgi:hypothetical protein